MPQSSGDLNYTNLNAVSQRGNVYFGAVNAQYVKLVMTSNYYNNQFVAISEFDIFQYVGAGCNISGQNNQIVSISSIPKKETNSTTFTVNATTNSNLPITYNVVSGPASINGNTVTLTGSAGTVTIKASQAGDANYYPASAQTSFEVVDLSTYFPVVKTKLTDAYALQMPTLMPYLLYSNANIPEPTFLSISSVDYEINGVSLPTTLVNGSYQAWWTPPSYGSYTVQVKATGSNGNVDYDTLNLNVVNTISTQTVQTFQNNVIDIGTIGSQWFYGSYKLPQSVGAYNKIMANFSVSCPSVPGGCDDWDRMAWVEYKAPNGEWMELFRYVTPYGVACNHSLDVTDYESILQGNIELRMYIETWGTGGWNLNLNFVYTQGTPQYLYSNIEELWHGTYNFGNPQNLQPMDTVSILPQNNVSKAVLRLVTTGHGWGNNNTGNAAEFYQANHNLKVNGVTTYTQNLWTLCNPNPDACTGQQGTWQYNRAGWCPGTIAKPYFYDLTPHLSSNPFQLSYIFQTSYQDICHPANPGCISGTTCPNCNDSYNPHYRIGGYLIRYSNSQITTSIKPKKNHIEEISLNIYPNPTSNIFYANLNSLHENIVITINDIRGATLKTYYFKNSTELNLYQFDVSKLSKGIYFFKAESKSNFCTQKIVIQ